MSFQFQNRKFSICWYSNIPLYCCDFWPRTINCQTVFNGAFTERSKSWSLVGPLLPTLFSSCIWGSKIIASVVFVGVRAHETVQYFIFKDESAALLMPLFTHRTKMRQFCASTFDTIFREKSGASSSYSNSPKLVELVSRPTSVLERAVFYTLQG